MMIADASHAAGFLDMAALSNLVDTYALFVRTYALLLTIIGVTLSTRKLKRFWKTRHLRKLWGIKERDYVLVVCSELDLK